MYKKLYNSKALMAILLFIITLVCGFFALNTYSADASSSVTTNDGFVMVNEANLRIDGDGLSFVVKFNQATLDEINDGAELHFALVPEKNIESFISVVNGGTFDKDKYSVEKKAYLDIHITADKISKDGDYYYAKAGVANVDASHRTMNYLAWAYCLSDGDYTFAKFYDGDYTKSTSNQYAELNYWIINSDKTSELFNQYTWFGGENYPIIVNSVEDYKGLVDVIENNTELFTGKSFNVDSEIINAIFQDETYYNEHSETITFVSKVEREYTVTLKDVDGTTIKSEKLIYGTVPSYQGSIYVETWDKEFVAVSEDATYTATSSIEYEYNGAGGYAVKNGKNWTLAKLTIPKDYNDGTNNELPVVSISGSAFYNNQNITHVYLSDNLTQIKGNAFHNCMNLTFLYLGGVSKLGGDSVDYGDEVNDSQINVFLACNNLRTVVIKKDLLITRQVFVKGSWSNDYGFNIYAEESGTVSGWTTGDTLWTANSKVYVYDDSEESACNTWKWNATGDGVVTKLHDEGLHGYCNTCFAKLNEKAAVTYTYDKDLDGYIASAKDTFNQAKLYVADYYNDGTNDRKAVKKIAASLFDSATTSTVGSMLTHVYLPDTITTIGSCAFRNCTNIQLVKMSANIETIEASAFQSCHGLTTMIIQKSLTCTTGAFNGGGAWKNAKMNIYALEAGGTVNITANNKPLFTGNVFVKDDNLSACNTWKWNATGDGVESKLHDEGLHGYCNNCFKKLTEKAALTYTYDKDLGGYVASDIGTFNQAKLYIAEYYNDGTNGKLPVKMIKASLFDGLSSDGVTKNRAAILTHVYMPDTIEVIGGASFRLCEKLVFVKMSANITTIVASAFQSCHALTTMIIQKSLECTTGAFNGGGSWKSATMSVYALEAGGTVNITDNGKPLFTGNVYVQGIDWDGYDENGIPKMIEN